jgi:hypothetical protein
MDKKLWKLDNYREFLEARKILLADAANSLLAELNHGPVPEKVGVRPVLENQLSIPGSIADAEEARDLEETNAWIESLGLPRGQTSYELIDADSLQPVAVIDLAWPDGLQAGLSTPAALMLNEAPETISAIAKSEYRVFTEIQDFREYVEKQVIRKTA